MKKLLIAITLIFFCSIPTFAERINVAFVIDNNYWLYTLLTINSIFINNESKSDYFFYIVENNLSNRNKKRIERFIKKHHYEVEFINVDTSQIDNGYDYYKHSEEHKYITRIAIARILLPELLSNINKVLYLDSDILVTRDLSELYDVDMKNYPIAMVGDITILKNNKMPQNVTYFNDGVMLINLDYWRKHNITLKMIDYMKEKGCPLKIDQDLFNIILKNNIMVLDSKWNNQLGCLTNEKGIIHYIGEVKPWFMKKQRSSNIQEVPYMDLYNKYWDSSAFIIYKIPLRLIQIYQIYLKFCSHCFERMYERIY